MARVYKNVLAGALSYDGFFFFLLYSRFSENCFFFQNFADKAITSPIEMEVQIEDVAEEFIVEDDLLLAKRAKLDENGKCSFQAAWKGTYEWLEYNEPLDKMLCSFCKKCPIKAGDSVFVNGTSDFRLDLVQAHHVSATHLSCMAKVNEEQDFAFNSRASS